MREPLPAGPLAAVADSPLFEGLSPADLERIAPHAHEKSFGAGAEIIVRDQPGHVVYVIAEGSVKVFVERFDGTQVILAVLGPGETVGEMSVVDRQGRSANVATLQDSRLVWMDRERFRDALREIPEMAYNLTRMLSRRLRLANDSLETVAALDVKGRVARQLLSLALEYGEVIADESRRIPIPLTQTDLAAMVGASRVRVNQALGEFRRSESISIEREGFVTIRDWAALARRAR